MVPYPFQVTFDTMSVSGSLACINITILEDDALEGDHGFSIQLSALSPDVVTRGSPPSAEIVIADNESKRDYVCMICAYDICRKCLHIFSKRGTSTLIYHSPTLAGLFRLYSACFQ